MTEDKVNKRNLGKYSSYLTDSEKELLKNFCQVNNDCSQAKALPLLLKFWHENKDSNVSYQLATISSEDISAKKYDERLATIEDKLANISYDAELATIKERLATLENMLASIADNELATISNELVNENKEDITAESTLAESPTMPLSEESGQMIPLAENKAVNGEIVENDKELTDKQREVMVKIPNIPAGESFSQNKLAQTLSVSRSVLKSFHQWLSYFDFDGKLYTKR